MTLWLQQQRQQQMQQQQQQQEGAWWLHPQPQPFPAGQERPSTSEQVHAPAIRTMFQPGQHHNTVSPPPPGALGWPGSTASYPTSAHSYGNLPAHPLAMGASQQTAPRKRSAVDLTAGEMPTPKRQAVAAPLAGAGTTQGSPQRLSRPSPHQQPQSLPPPPPRDPRIMSWAQVTESGQHKSAASQGQALSPKQRQERVEALYRYAFEKKRAGEEKQRQEKFRLAQIEVRRVEDQKKRSYEEAQEGLRIAQVQERDRLAQTQIAQRQERALQEEERRNAARVVAAAEKQRREIFRRAEIAEKERQEAAQIDAAAALERERRAKRKAELKRDPNRNFHSYMECLEHWPLARGERQNPYMRTLLANQRMPLTEDRDTAIAIKYAREHWYLYRQYPRDMARTIKEAKADEKKERAAAEKK